MTIKIALAIIFSWFGNSIITHRKKVVKRANGFFRILLYFFRFKCLSLYVVSWRHLIRQASPATFSNREGLIGVRRA